MAGREGEVVVAEIDQALCRGCGACVTVCPTGASVVSHFTEERVTQALEGMLPSARDRRSKKLRPQIVALACHWSAYPLLSAGGWKLSADLHALRVMCLGSLSPGLILRALELGADGVLLLGCGPEKCHYSFGNRVAETQVHMAEKLMHVLGIEKGRVGLENIPAGDRKRLHGVVRRFTNRIKKLGPNSFGG
jgi:F420-non-reducing hydrogenase iron-sulfur subunit